MYLPPISTGKCLHYAWFPTKQQCFIYRNWQSVSVQRMAEILETEESNVLALAEEMGLPLDVQTTAPWTQKGYITLIRANWHLLSYEQLCKLLGWSAEQLSFALAEDDFLDVKLGLEKPDTGILHYRPLTQKEHLETRFLRQQTENTLKEIQPVQVQPFDFESRFEKHCPVNTHITSDIDRICYSYCAIYGDVFSSKALIDESYPDALLQAYADCGINGLWTQAVLYTLTPYPFDPHKSEGYEQRQEGLRYLIAKLARFGIRLFLYLNEPRAMELSFFEGREYMKGSTYHGSAALCLSLPEVQTYLRTATAELVKSAPGLGGIFTITASENLTNCYSRTEGHPCPCPRCAKRSPAEIYALANRLIYEGATSVEPNLRVIAWSWGWQEDQIHQTIRLLPQGIAVMGVSEQYCEKQFDQTNVRVLDYSISVEGPGNYALESWKTARECGHPIYAKVQVNNSWEMSAVPYLPVFEKIYRHMYALFEKANPDGLFLSWTLGGYPSITLRMLERFLQTDKPLPSLDEFYAEVFQAEDIPQLKNTFHLLSEAFDAFPFDMQVAYEAPQHFAPANLLFKQKTGYSASMVGYPHDDLERWRSIFPEETFLSQLHVLSDRWEIGVNALQDAVQTSSDPQLDEILRYAKVCQNHFRSTYLQACFVRDRDRGILRKDILEEERKIALSEASLMAEDPMIGYEASNHYFFTRQALLEKALCCAYLLEHG